MPSPSPSPPVIWNHQVCIISSNGSKHDNVAAPLHSLWFCITMPQCAPHCSSCLSVSLSLSITLFLSLLWHRYPISFCRTSHSLPNQFATGPRPTHHQVLNPISSVLSLLLPQLELLCAHHHTTVIGRQRASALSGNWPRLYRNVSPKLMRMSPLLPAFHPGTQQSDLFVNSHCLRYFPHSR